MKNLFLTGLFLLVAFTMSIAAPAAAPAIAGNKYMQSIKDFPAKAAGFDSLAGVDSVTLATKISIPAGSSYILQRGAMTGTAADGSGTDSIAIGVVVYSYDQKGNLFQITDVDTFNTVAGEQIAIPFFDTIFGDKFTIKLVGHTGNGGQVILPAMKLYVRKVFTETKPVLLSN